MRKFLVGVGIVVILLAAALWCFSEPDIPRATLEAKYATPPSQFVTLPDGARAHVRDRGPRDVQALVLIHGSNASLFTWEPWAKRLDDTFRVVTVDMPAHGLTGAVPNGDYSQEGMVKFVGEVAGALGLQKFAIGGNSMGGRIAALFAAEYPGRVTHLILVDSGGLPSKQGDQWLIQYGQDLAIRLARTPIASGVLLHITPRLLLVKAVNEVVARKDIITDAMIDAYWEFIRMEGTRAATIARFNTRNNGVKDHLSAIKAPTLILWGEEDHMVPVETAREFQSAIPGSKLIIYPKTGHAPQEEVADASADDVRSFLSGTQVSVGRQEK
jgi:pimeloyl-ACP methyl ester carboxylesterase